MSETKALAKKSSKALAKKAPTPRRSPKGRDDEDLMVTFTSTLSGTMKLAIAAAERATWRLAFGFLAGGLVAVPLALPVAKPMLLLGAVMTAARIGGHLDDRALAAGDQRPAEVRQLEPGSAQE